MTSRTTQSKGTYKNGETKEKVNAKGMSYAQFIYVGDDLSMTQLMIMLFSDVMLAGFALLSIAVYVLMHTGSGFLTFMGLMNVLLAFPLAFWLYTGLFHIESLPILTPVTLIVCIGIAVDDVFVFVDTFKQTDAGESLDGRVAKMISSCVSATAFTTLSSVSAFAANTVSDVVALSNFGLLTALVVGLNWIILVMIIPSAIGFWWRYLAPCKATTFLCCCYKRDNTVNPSQEHGNVISARSHSTFVMDRPMFGPNSDRVLSERDPDDAIMAPAGASIGRTEQLAKGNAPPSLPARPGLGNIIPDASDADTGASDGVDPTRQHQEARSVEVNGGVRVTVGARGTNMGGIHGVSELVESKNMTILQSALAWVGCKVVDFKWSVLAIYGILIVVMFYQASQLQPSTEGPQLFTKDTNLGRAATLESVFADFSATGGSEVDAPALSSISGWEELARDPELADAGGNTTFNCAQQFKAAGTASIVNGVVQAYLQCADGTQLIPAGAGIDCPGMICTNEECCEDSTQCKAYLDHVNPALCSGANKISLVADDNTASDITCAGTDGCDVDTCCSDLTCKIYFEADPSKATGFCTANANTFVDVTSKDSCISTTECTANECCTNNPTCAEASFAESACANDGNKHLKENQNNVVCARQTCTLVDCCADNDQCSVFFAAEDPNVCLVRSKVKVVKTTVCTSDPCHVSDCCTEEFCDTSFGLDPTICSAGAFHLKTDAATENGHIPITIDGVGAGNCCTANPTCDGAGFMLGDCNGKKHLKENQNSITCACTVLFPLYQPTPLSKQPVLRHIAVLHARVRCSQGLRPNHWWSRVLFVVSRTCPAC
jgi:hypothetical protein